MSLAITFCPLFKYADLFRCFGLSLDLNTAHLLRLIEVNFTIFLLICLFFDWAHEFISLGMEDNRLAFQRHFERELLIYGKLCVVSLVEQSGKEKIIGDAFTEHMIQLNEEKVTYVTFDFHEHWCVY